MNYEILGSIVKTDSGYNILDGSGQLMLVNSYRDLKTMLQDLLRYM